MSSRGSAVERAMTRIYDRTGAMYLVLVASVVTVIACLFATFDMAIMQLYRDVGTRDFTLLLVLGELVNAAGLAVGVAAFGLRPLLRIARWIRGGHSPADARQIIDLVVALPLRLVGLTTVVILALEIPAILYFRTQASGDVSIVVIIVALLAPNAAAGFFILLILEQLFRPIVRTAHSRLGSEDRGRPRAGLTLGRKLWLGLPILTFMTAYVTAAVAQRADTVSGRLTWGVAAAAVVTLTVSLILTTAIVRSVNEPVHELIAASGRIREGDLSTQVPALSGDELGVLADHFNDMIDGLRERAVLRDRNAVLVSEVRASRARIVAASDAERKRIERNIHDGAQQQLVALALKLRMLEDTLDDEHARSSVRTIQDRLTSALAELRELARGLHPSVLSTDGLQPALAHLAEHAAVPVEIDAPDRRFPEIVESTAYYIAAEALANVAKYANATHASVLVNAVNGSLTVTITDDGIGGAHAEPGSGLAGLKDRVEAIDGQLTITSPAGAGTRLTAELPLP